jgi:microcystin-dependent protein
LLATAPPGAPLWLHCNGDSLGREEYADLFAAIETSWGAEDDATFKLPNLRGLFIRGVQADRTNGGDPEAGDRIISSRNSNTGNAVGSFQKDAMETHTHQLMDLRMQHQLSKTRACTT